MPRHQSRDKKKIGANASNLMQELKEELTPENPAWCLFWVVVIPLLLYSVAGAGVAWDLFANRHGQYSWTLSGPLQTDGTTTTYLPKCTNLTYTPQNQTIGNHRRVAIYNSCPQPRSACEVGVCGSDGVCLFGLASGAQCAYNQDCIALYNSIASTCNGNCMCVNTTQAGALNPFVPANVTFSSGVYDDTVSYYEYRAIGGTLEVEMQFYATAVGVVAGSTETVVFDISNLPYTLVHTATSYGMGYGSIMPNVYPTLVYGFPGIRGYASADTEFTFEFKWDNAGNATSTEIYYNLRFVDQYT